MNLTLHRSDDFNRDFDLQYRWYLQQAGEAVAERYLQAFLGTLRLLAAQPGLGRQRKFRHPALRGLRSFRLASPFEVHLIFYRHRVEYLFALYEQLTAPLLAATKAPRKGRRLQPATEQRSQAQ